jgi:hypothetical protein
MQNEVPRKLAKAENTWIKSTCKYRTPNYGMEAGISGISDGRTVANVMHLE